MVLGPAFEYEIEHQWRQLARLQEQAGWQRAARLQRPAARRPLPRLASRGRLWAWLPLPRRSPPRRRPALSMQNTQPRLVIALPSEHEEDDWRAAGGPWPRSWSGGTPVPCGDSERCAPRHRSA
jgi:hypothetical protein